MKNIVLCFGTGRSKCTLAEHWCCSGVKKTVLGLRGGGDTTGVVSGSGEFGQAGSGRAVGCAGSF